MLNRAAIDEACKSHCGKALKELEACTARVEAKFANAKPGEEISAHCTVLLAPGVVLELVVVASVLRDIFVSTMIRASKVIIHPSQTGSEVLICRICLHACLNKFGVNVFLHVFAYFFIPRAADSVRPSARTHESTHSVWFIRQQARMCLCKRVCTFCIGL